MKSYSEASIFLVEDNEMYSLMLDHKLKDFMNFRLKTFASAEDCIENLYQKPDIVILDYKLPKMNGIEALKAIKEFNNDIPVVVLSGQENIDVALDASRFGALGYVIKDKNAISKIFEYIGKALIQVEDKKGSYTFTIRKEILHFILWGIVVLGTFTLLLIKI
ncbi:MAG: response regulator [Bacteroidetes bacterium]|nr:response regulator [Bacteroidia bacterium]PCH65942.1 MAG: response regulator [Bacteroidota bacterium]